MSDAITPRRAAEAMREQAAQEAEQTSAHGLVAPLIRESIAAAIRALPLPDEPEAGAELASLRALLTKAAEAMEPIANAGKGYGVREDEPLYVRAGLLMKVAIVLAEIRRATQAEKGEL